MFFQENSFENGVCQNGGHFVWGDELALVTPTPDFEHIVKAHEIRFSLR